MSSLEPEISMMLFDVVTTPERVMFHYAEIIIEIFYLLFIIHHKPS